MRRVVAVALGAVVAVLCFLAATEAPDCPDCEDAVAHDNGYERICWSCGRWL